MIIMLHSIWKATNISGEASHFTAIFTAQRVLIRILYARLKYLIHIIFIII